MTVVKLRYTESDSFGSNGFQVYKRNSKLQDYASFYASLSSKLLAHDILDHCLTSVSHPNAQELTALGVILAYRDHDFYNLRGDDGFYSEVALQLENGYYTDLEREKLPYSASDAVKERLKDSWEEIAREYHESTDQKCSKRMKALAYRFMSRGYNHVEKIGRYYFDRMYYELDLSITEFIKYPDFYEGEMVNVYYNLNKCEVVIKREELNYDEY
jgi:hypothetical protein